MAALARSRGSPETDVHPIALYPKVNGLRKKGKIESVVKL